MKRVWVSMVLILFFITIGTIAAILYARGYRFLPENGRAHIEGTGLLVLTSKPEGARVEINNHLTTATNNTINLSPGKYDVVIEKDGYIPWKKQIVVDKEVVSEVNALLYPTAPKLEAITSTGATNPVLDTTGTLIAYTVSSSSATKNGAYVLDMNARPLISFGGQTTQITNNQVDAFSDATLSFSPDGKEMLAQIKTQSGITSYLLPVRNFTDTPQDVTTSLFQVQKDWEQQAQDKNKKILDSFPKELRTIVIDNFSDFSMSPEGDKILYTASQSALLPIVKKPRIVGGNSTLEQRKLTKGNTYVYDIKDDRNYIIFDKTDIKESETSPRFFWNSDSRHLVFAKYNKITILEYDGGNPTTVYAGPFLDNYIFPWPDGTSIAIITRLNPGSPYNIYKLGLQ